MEKSHLTTWEISDSIGIMTIDNPPQNRLSEPDFINLDSFISWTGSDELKGIIITGKGRHFSSGADMDALRLMAMDERSLMGRMQTGKRLLAHLELVNIPLIAAIEGACFGGGLEIALACHIRICSGNALFAFPEVNNNLMPGMGGTVRLPAMVGFGKAMETILSGDIIDADRAVDIGLADHLTPPHRAFDFSMALMKKMVADRPVEVIRSIVRALNNTRAMTVNEAMEEETKMFCRLAVKMHG